MTGLDHVIFARRQSPDWEALARDHEAGRTIDPSRYLPPIMVPGFPGDIAACIQLWNERFPVNFFRCRQLLKALSERCLQLIGHSRIISADRLDALRGLAADARFLLFFYDDDDWFAPDLFERLAALDFDQCDIAVFPLPRFGDRVFTFVRDGEAARAIAGYRRGFGHRFQTNNYGIAGGIAVSEHLPHLSDHVLGSAYADRVALRDRYFDVLISATNKTPCSANTVGALPADPDGYRGFIQRYVKTLRGLAIPDELSWTREPLRQTIDLFSSVAAGKAGN